MTATIPLAPFPLAPESIKVSGPTRGHYNLLGTEESDRYMVTIDGVLVSVTVPIDRSDYIAGTDWAEQIPAIADEAKKWFGGSDSNAKRDALHEWINREDPEEERLIAIEAAQLEHDAQAAFRDVRRLWHSTQTRVLELLKEAIR